MRGLGPLLVGGTTFAATIASAADLPSAKSAPVEYVRVCSVHGEGFWYIPGTDTCIRLNGRVRAEFGYFQPSWTNGILFTRPTPGDPNLRFPYVEVPSAGPGAGRNINATGFVAEARLDADIRTSTEWGLLRAVVRYDFFQSTGGFNPSGFTTYNGATLDRAFVQFGAFTAGRLQSFFDFYTNDWNWQSIAGSDHVTNLFAYTASFGQGFSATLSIEDPTVTAVNGIQTVASTFYDQAVGNTRIYYPWYVAYAGGYAYGGTRMPDLVANLRVDQSWGSAQLSGAVHQLHIGIPSEVGFVPGLGGYTPPDIAGAFEYPGTQYGYAIQAGVKIALPFLAQGDALALQAAYASGASTYLGVGNVAASLNPQGLLASDADVGLNCYSPDGICDASLKRVSGWALTASLLHYWAPSVRQAVFGSLLSLKNPSYTDYWREFVTPSDEAGYIRYGRPDTKTWQVGTNLIWSPVAKLDIGAEVGYIWVDPSGQVPVAAVPTGSTTAPLGVLTTKNEGQFYTRLRIQRDF